MRFFRRFFPWIISGVLLIVLAACGAQATDSTEDGASITNDEESSLGVVEVDIVREAPSDSDYSGVNLVLTSYERTDAVAGAEAGTIVLDIRLENTTDATVTLPFNDDDYTILDSGGLSIVPTILSEALQMPEIEANSSVEGSLEYAVTEAEGTFILQVGDYEGITFSTIPPE